jgi:hypothetical protein
MAVEASAKLPFDRIAFDELRHHQDGVVTRQQVLALNGTDADIARMIRRRELAAVHFGVFVDHTGPLSWKQRAWAAVLYYWPAALSHQSALPKPRVDGAIHVAVDRSRHVARLPGVVLHRTVRLEARAHWISSPPRLPHEDAVVDVAAESDDVPAMFAVLADACQTRLATAGRIRSAALARRRLYSRRLLLDLLDDLEQGACSVLEREYLQLEERHGLPTQDRRQVPVVLDGKRAYRDVDHSEFGWLVELDGGAFHDSASQRTADAARDLVGAVEADLRTLRLTYGQVFTDGCTTVRAVATLLERGGWPGPFRRCPECPTP